MGAGVGDGFVRLGGTTTGLAGQPAGRQRQAVAGRCAQAPQASTPTPTCAGRVCRPGRRHRPCNHPAHAHAPEGEVDSGDVINDGHPAASGRRLALLQQPGQATRAGAADRAGRGWWVGRQARRRGGRWGSPVVSNASLLSQTVSNPMQQQLPPSTHRQQLQGGVCGEGGDLDGTGGQQRRLACTTAHTQQSKRKQSKVSRFKMHRSYMQQPSMPLLRRPQPTSHQPTSPHQALPTHLRPCSAAAWAAAAAASGRSRPAGRASWNTLEGGAGGGGDPSCVRPCMLGSPTSLPCRPGGSMQKHALQPSVSKICSKLITASQARVQADFGRHLALRLTC